MGKKVTIKDIAKEAGVSIATVSYFMNGHYASMSEEVRERLEGIVRDMDYHPSSIARSLKLNRSRTVGIIANGLHGQVGFLMLKGACSYLDKAGYNTLIFISDDDPEKEREQIRHCIENQVAGIIITASMEEVDSGFENLKKVNDSGVKVVIVNRYTDQWPYDGAMLDYVSATRRMVALLSERGFTKTAFFFDNENDEGLSVGKRMRRDTFAEAAGSRFGADAGSLIYYGIRTEQAAMAALNDFLARYPGEQKAIFTVNSPVLALAMRAIRSQGLSVPEDVGLCGFGGWDWSSIVQPSLTVLTQPLDDVGETAARLLVDRIEQRADEARAMYLETELIEGNSTLLKR